MAGGMKNWPGLSWPRRAGKVENVLTLGIDTATRVCSVAVCDNNKILGSLEVNVGLTHSEGLVPQLETLLKLARVEKEQLELIAVSRGPGSFTGLRIGMATAEAMAYALDLPLVAVDTLEAIAYNLPVAGVRLIPVLDAQKGNLYVGSYRWEKDRLVETEPVRIAAAQDLAAQLQAGEGPAILMGECHRVPGTDNCGQVTLAPESARLPRGSSAAILGAAQYVPGGNLHAYFGMDPFYIRRSEAEELWEKRHPEGR